MHMLFKQIAVSKPSNITVEAVHQMFSVLHLMSRTERASFATDLENKQRVNRKAEAADHKLTPAENTVNFARTIISQFSFLKDEIPSSTAPALGVDTLRTFFMKQASLASEEVEAVRRDKSMRKPPQGPDKVRVKLNTETLQQVTSSPIFLDVKSIMMMEPAVGRAELEAQVKALYGAQDLKSRVTYKDPKNGVSQETAFFEYFLDTSGIVTLEMIATPLLKNEITERPGRKLKSLFSAKKSQAFQRKKEAKIIIDRLIKVVDPFLKAMKKGASKGGGLPQELNLLVDMFYINIGTKLSLTINKLQLTDKKYQKFQERFDKCVAFMGTANYTNDFNRPFPSLSTISSVYQTPSPFETAFPPFNLVALPKQESVYGADMQGVLDLDVRNIAQDHKNLVGNYYLDLFKAIGKNSEHPILPNAPAAELKPVSKPAPVTPRRKTVQDDGFITPQRPSRKVRVTSSRRTRLLSPQQIEKDVAQLKTCMNDLAVAAIEVQPPRVVVNLKRATTQYIAAFKPVFEAIEQNLKRSGFGRNKALTVCAGALEDLYSVIEAKFESGEAVDLIPSLLRLHADLKKFSRSFNAEDSPVTTVALRQLTAKVDRTQIPSESTGRQSLNRTLNFDPNKEPVKQTNSSARPSRVKSGTNPFQAFNNPFYQPFVPFVPFVEASTQRSLVTERVATPAQAELPEFALLEEESDTEESSVNASVMVPDDLKLNGSSTPEPLNEMVPDSDYEDTYESEPEDYNEELAIAHDNPQTPKATMRNEGADSGYKSINRTGTAELEMPEPFEFEESFAISSASNILTPQASPARPVRHTEFLHESPENVTSMFADVSESERGIDLEMADSADGVFSEELASLISEVSVPAVREEGDRVRTPSENDEAGFPFDVMKSQNDIAEERPDPEVDEDVLSLDEVVDLSLTQEVELPVEVMPTPYESLMALVTSHTQFRGEIETVWNSRVNGGAFTGWVGTEIKGLHSKSENAGFTGLSKAVLVAKKDEFLIKNKRRLRQFRLSPPTQQKINKSSFLKFLNDQSTDEFIQGLEQIQQDSSDLKKGIETVSARQLELAENMRYFDAILKNIEKIPEADSSPEILEIQKWAYKQNSDIKDATESLTKLLDNVKKRQKRIQKAYTILSMSDLSLKAHQVKVLEKYKLKQASCIDILRVFSSTIPDWVLKTFPELGLHVELARALSPSSDLNKMRGIVAFNTKNVKINKWGAASAHKLLILCEKHHQRELVENMIPGIDRVFTAAKAKIDHDEKIKKIKKVAVSKADKANKKTIKEKKEAIRTAKQKKVGKLKRSGLRLH